MLDRPARLRYQGEGEYLSPVLMPGITYHVGSVIVVDPDSGLSRPATGVGREVIQGVLTGQYNDGVVTASRTIAAGETGIRGTVNRGLVWIPAEDAETLNVGKPAYFVDDSRLSFDPNNDAYLVVIYDADEFGYLVDIR